MKCVLHLIDSQKSSYLIFSFSSLNTASPFITHVVRKSIGPL